MDGGVKMAEIKWKTKEELEAERNQPSPIETLEQSQTDLIFTLMMNGVI